MGPDPWGDLARIANLDRNWDGNNSAPISNQAAVWAGRILANLDETVFLHTSIVPCNDGGVQLEWHYDSHDLEVEISPDGSLSIYSEWEATAAVTQEQQLDGITEKWINAILTMSNEKRPEINE